MLILVLAEGVRSNGCEKRRYDWCDGTKFKLGVVPVRMRGHDWCDGTKFEKGLASSKISWHDATTPPGPAIPSHISSPLLGI